MRDVFSISRGVFFVIAGLSLCDVAVAIVTRHDVDDDLYIVDDADYPALVDLFEPGDCIGTLIEASHLLTVAHCAEDLRAGDRLSVAGTRHEIDEVLLHPDYDGWTYDIALVRFLEPVAGVTPLPLYRETDEDGQTLILVGRGLHATGLEGEPGATTDGALRRATNVVTKTSKHWIEVFFEEPGESGITDMEGVGAGGDSGSPAFIETEAGLLIAGLNSWGDSDPPVRIAQYGAWDYSTRVSAHLDWIDGEAGLSPGTSTEPGAETGGDEAASEGGGCGCVTGGSPVGWIALWVGAGVALSRRRW